MAEIAPVKNLLSNRSIPQCAGLLASLIADDVQFHDAPRANQHLVWQNFNDEHTALDLLCIRLNKSTLQQKEKIFKAMAMLFESQFANTPLVNNTSFWYALGMLELSLHAGNSTQKPVTPNSVSDAAKMFRTVLGDYIAAGKLHNLVCFMHATSMYQHLGGKIDVEAIFKNPVLRNAAPGIFLPMLEDTRFSADMLQHLYLTYFKECPDVGTHYLWAILPLWNTSKKEGVPEERRFAMFKDIAEVMPPKAGKEYLQAVNFVLRPGFEPIAPEQPVVARSVSHSPHP